MATRIALLGGVALQDSGTSTLNGAINNSITTITVASTTSFKSAGTISIDNERINYTGKNATQFTGCTRGVYGTSAASHLDTTAVYEIEIVNDTDLNDTFTAINTQASDSYYAGLPLGAIIAFHASFTGASIPAQYVECNGQPITDGQSPFYGQNTPNLNGTSESTKRFIRGASTSGTSGGSDTHTHSIPNQYIGTGSTTSWYKRSMEQSSHIPPYFEARWIMRIK